MEKAGVKPGEEFDLGKLKAILSTGSPLSIESFFLAGTAGIASLVTGLISIINSKERSVFAFLAAGIGLFVLIFVLGEILSPH